MPLGAALYGRQLRIRLKNRELGLEQTVCIGNGRNDRLMLKAAALGLAVILEEGIAGETIGAADCRLPLH